VNRADLGRPNGGGKSGATEYRFRAKRDTFECTVLGPLGNLSDIYIEELSEIAYGEPNTHRVSIYLADNK
jgi:hypothetical protein